MPICIECRYPVKTLYTEYSGADDRSSGHGVRLTVCRNCGRFCDKYVEHDFVVLFIDLVLIKPQVGMPRPFFFCHSFLRNSVAFLARPPRRCRTNVPRNTFPLSAPTHTILPLPTRP